MPWGHWGAAHGFFEADFAGRLPYLAGPWQRWGKAGRDRNSVEISPTGAGGHLRRPRLVHTTEDLTNG